MLFELDKESFQNLVLNTDQYVLVDFFAPWCRGCEAYEEILEEISEDYYGKLKVYKLNIENESEIADSYDVMSLPTLLLFKSGTVSRELTGLQSKKTVESWLKL